MHQIRFQNKKDLLIVGYGLVLVLFYASILVSRAIHGDLVLTKSGYSLQHKLPDIAVVLHLSVGFLIMFAPIRRKVFGALALVLTLGALSLAIYFNANETVLGAAGLIFGLFVVLVLLGAPSLYLLFAPSPQPQNGLGK
ncbi:MAG: hypothetical protein ACP5HM_13095 [Anaerolineae bacterium]